MTNEKADNLRHTIDLVREIRDNLTSIYNTGFYGTMIHTEQLNLYKSITQIDISLRKMGKRLLVERLEQ